MALTGDIAHPSGHCPVPCAPGCSCLSSELGPEPHCGPFNLPHAVTAICVLHAQAPAAGRFSLREHQAVSPAERRGRHGGGSLRERGRGQGRAILWGRSGPRPAPCSACRGPPGPTALAVETEGSGAAAPSAIAALSPPWQVSPSSPSCSRPEGAAPAALPRRALPSAVSPPLSPFSPFLSASRPLSPPCWPRTAAARPSLPLAGGSRLPAASTMLAGRGSPWPRGSRAVHTSPLLFYHLCGK